VISVRVLPGSRQYTGKRKCHRHKGVANARHGPRMPCSPSDREQASLARRRVFVGMLSSGCPDRHRRTRFIGQIGRYEGDASARNSAAFDKAIQASAWIRSLPIDSQGLRAVGETHPPTRRGVAPNCKLTFH